MSYNSRLFTQPKLREIVDITDSISNICEEVSDALSAYEQAEDEEDPVSAREEAREQAWTGIGELLAYAEELKAKREWLEKMEEARG